MRRMRLAFAAMLAASCFASSSEAQQSEAVYKRQIRQVEYQVGAVSPSDVATGVATTSYATGCADGCDHGQGAGAGSCDASACDSMAGGCLGGSLGEPWRLVPADNALGLNIGGWSNIGYHTNNTFGTFNTYKNRVQLQQQWFYAEKVADGSNGLGLGGRIDYLYGTDAPDTQSFGIPNNHWDNSWDNGGAYGHAIPQLYGEVAMGSTAVKVGHFFTIIGNEVVAATGNFFYSRQFTFYNAEPFTHTGALATTTVDDQTTLYNGYVMGWDSGFEDNGDAYLGGFKRQISDSTSLLYATALGRFGENNWLGGERGTIHSVLLTNNLTDRLTYIGQADWMFTNDAADVGVRNTFGTIHYLIYKLNDRWSVGSRSEWFNLSQEATGIRNADLYNQTFGFNYRATSNLLFRPEIRQVWDKEALGANDNGGTSEMTFGTDMIFTF